MTAIRDDVGPIRRIRKITINGQQLSAELTEQITDGSITLSVTSEPVLEFTVADHPEMPLTGQLSQLLAEGTTLGWESNIFALTRFAVAGAAESPQITVEATAETVHQLDEERGAHSWNETDVSNWAKGIIRSAGSVPVVQPGLGSRMIERKADDQVPENGETTWDVLAETAKKVGAWVFENGERIVFGKPSWLVQREDTRQAEIEWNSWVDHTDGVVEVPAYEWEWKAKPWEGREKLTVVVYEPATEEIVTDTLHYLRPGDRILYTGTAAPTRDPLWVITQIARPIYTGGQITIQCQRPIDPPEIVDGDPAAAGEGTAGVPTGPLGQFGWTGEQLENAAEIVREGQRRQLPEKAMVLAVQTAMAESSLINKKHGDEIYGVRNPNGTLTTSKGLFQQQDPWGPLDVRMNPAKSAGLFYEALMNLGEAYKSAVDGPSSSMVIHRVQGNQDPMVYAKFWPDANTVVRACLEAARSAKEGSKAEGDLGKRIDELMGSYAGKYIDVDGSFGAQCYDLAQKYITDLKGIGMITADGIDFYKHSALTKDFTTLPANTTPRKGDIVSWGVNSDYANFIAGKYRGHVAIYSHHVNGQPHYLTQNPGRANVSYLNPRGILGYMRPKD